MITGIDLNQTINYISKLDEGSVKTVWKIGLLPTPVLSYCSSKFLNENQSLDGMIEVVKFGLKGFENFKDKSGNNILFEQTARHLGNRVFDVVTDNIINIIPMQIIAELGAEILRIQNLSSEEIKN